MNEGRRKLFKAAIFGGVGVVLWKVFGGRLGGVVSGEDRLKDLPAKTEGQKIVFFDKETGEEIFILDNEE